MIESTYITATQAVSWIAFSDFDGLSKAMVAHDRSLEKWRISDKDTLLACFIAIENNSRWLKQERVKAGGAELSREKAKGIIKFLSKPVSELIIELSHEIETENNACSTQKFEQAETDFLEALRAEKILMRGIKTGGNGNSEIIATDFLLRDDIVFTHLDNKLSVWGSRFEWGSLKVKIDDVLKIWPELSASNQSEKSKTTAFPVNISLQRLVSEITKNHLNQHPPRTKHGWRNAVHNELKNHAKLKNIAIDTIKKYSKSDLDDYQKREKEIIIPDSSRLNT